MTTELLSLIEYVPEPMRTFLNTPLSLGQFVPCDDEGNVMDEPKEWIHEVGKNYGHDEQMKRYQAAKDRVLFDGFEQVTKTQDGIIIISNDYVSIAFYPSGTIEAIGIAKAKTISDLCGYGINQIRTI